MFCCIGGSQRWLGIWCCAILACWFSWFPNSQCKTSAAFHGIFISWGSLTPISDLCLRLKLAKPNSNFDIYSSPFIYYRKSAFVFIAVAYIDGLVMMPTISPSPSRDPPADSEPRLPLHSPLNKFILFFECPCFWLVNSAVSKPFGSRISVSLEIDVVSSRSGHISALPFKAWW